VTPLRLTAALTLQAASGGRPRRFRILAYSGGKLLVSGFAAPVVVDLAGLTATTAIPICLDHETTTDSTLGQTSAIANDGKSLILSGEITGQSQRVRDVIAQADAGYTWQASIGCSVEQQQEIPSGQSVSVNGQTFIGPVIVARRSILRETSVLPVGADATTSVNLAASAASLAKESYMPTFEEWIAKLGIDPAKLDDADKAILVTAYDAAQTSPATDPNATAATAAAVLNLRATAAADHERIAKINSITIGHPEVAATAIRAGWSPDKTELELFKRITRSTAPMNMTRHTSAGTTSDHLSAALMVKAGYSAAAEKQFGERVMEQSRPLHGNSLVDMCRASLMIDGRECPSDRGQMIRAAFSTGSMPVALGDSANKILIDAYTQAPASWRSFAAVKPAANFRTQVGVRPTWAGDLEQLPPGGEIKHGSFNEETYEWHVDTFAKQFKITRQDIVNDDASVFSDMIPGLARAAARSLNSLVATTLLANAGSFFGSANANYFEGADTNLQASSLATAIKMLRQMTDAEGNLLDLAPAVLLVPPELEQTALALLNSSEVQRVATGDQQPTGNTFQNIAQLAVEPRLSTATFTGYSAVAWYLFSNAMNASVIVGFLDGMESPTLESFGLDHDVNTLGYSFRVYFDYGCALADHRAAIRSKGSA